MIKDWTKLLGSVFALAVAAYAVVANSYDAGTNTAVRAMCKYAEEHPNETFKEFFTQKTEA